MIIRKMKHLTIEEERYLVQQAQSGSRTALNRLIETHYQQMYHLALKITRDTILAEDITQEACVQVLRRIDQFRSEARFNSWLSRIVLNTALLKHRREKRLVPTEEIYSPDAVSLEPQPDQVVMDREILEKTDTFLGALRDGDRDLFIKRFIEGQSLQNISDETGLSLPALKSRFHRARQRLKDVADSCKWEFETPTSFG